MLRRTLRRAIGGDGDITMSVISDKTYIAKRIAQVGKGETHWKPAAMTDEEVQRMAISVHSPENLFNKRNGVKEPSWVVDEEHEKKLGPTRYGDWEKNGRAMDF